MGTVGLIVQLLRLPDGTVKGLVEGKRRARIRRFLESEQFFLCEVETAEERGTATVEIEGSGEIDFHDARDFGGPRFIRNYS